MPRVASLVRNALLAALVALLLSPAVATAHRSADDQPADQHGSWSGPVTPVATHLATGSSVAKPPAPRWDDLTSAVLPTTAAPRAVHRLQTQHAAQERPRQGRGVTCPKMRAPPT